MKNTPLKITSHHTHYYIFALFIAIAVAMGGQIGDRIEMSKVDYVKADTCGNGVIEGAEQCDDSNTANGDGCTSICQISQAGFGANHKITIYNNKVNADLTNFPILLKDNHFIAAVYQNTKADGSDLLFSSDVNGGSLIPFEVVSWNTGAKTSEVWVKIPSLANATDTIIYAWYNNPSATMPAPNAANGKYNVWDINYKGVWHMNETATDEGTGAVHYDSTSNQNNGTQYGNTNVTGKFGKAQSFDGNNDYINVPDSNSLDLTSQATISVWSNSRELGLEFDRIITKLWTSETSPWAVYGLYENANSGEYYLNLGFYDSTRATSFTTTKIPLNEWSYLTGVYDGAYSRIYYNGAQQDADAATKNLQTNNMALRFGGYYSAFKNSSLDEIRISAVGRSAGWISTEYNNQNSPSTFAGYCGDSSVLGPEQCDDGNAVSGDGCSSTCQISAYGYNYKQRLTIDYTKVGETVTNFPVLLKDANFDPDVYSKSEANGRDLLFTSDEAGTSFIPFEIVNWNTASQASEVWVKLPSISNSENTTFYVWYDNPAAIAPSTTVLNGKKNVFSNGYVGVWHFSDLQWDDTFSSASLDTAKWTNISGSGGTATINAGKLRLNKPAVGSSSATVKSVYTVSGDFDIYVDFSLITFPTLNGGLSSDYIAAYLDIRNINNSSATADWTYFGRRSLKSGGQYRLWRTQGGDVSDSSTSGKFRLVREGTGLWAYYWNGSAWVQHSTTYNSFTTADMKVQLNVWSTAGAPDAATVDFDNFTVYQGEIVADSSPSSNNGYIDGASWSATGIGNSLSFDGTNDYVEIPDSSSLDISSQITMGVWLYPRDSTAEYDRVITKSYGADIDPWHTYGINRGANNQKYGSRVTFTDSTASLATTTSDAPLNQWSYITSTYNGTNSKIYFNAQLQATSSSVSKSIMTNNLPVTIGANHWEREYCNSVFDEIRISNTARSAGWILTEYNNMNSPSTFTSAGNPERGLPLYSNFPVLYGTTDFESVSDLESVPNMKLSNANGSIAWSGTINAKSEDYDSNVSVGQGFVSLNTAGLHSSIDSPATVSVNVNGCNSYTVYYATGFRNSLDDIKTNGQVCNASTTPACTNIRCLNGVLTFNVPHFDGYGGEGQASDVGTTAGVTNSSPVFTVTPSDGGSDTSAPTNVGSNVAFTATAKDISGSQYYLAICKTDVVTAGNNTAPTCDGGAWAISVEANSNAQASVNHLVQSSDAESNAWYAFVCDKISSVSLCYPANGSGDQGNAVGTITFTGIPADGATLTINSVTYEFDTANNGVAGGNTEVDTSNSQVEGESAGALIAVEAGADSHMARRSNIVYIYADTEGAGGNSIGMAEAGDTGNVLALSGTNLTGGSDANKSPFNVNHMPQVTDVTINDSGSSTVEPGEAVYFRVTISDSDTGNTASVYVCATDSFTSGSGCAANQTICEKTNQAVGTVTCNSGDLSGDLSATYNPVPTSHGSKTVYVFAEDNHLLQADYSSETQSRTYSVTDVAPAWQSYTATDVPAPAAGGSDTVDFAVALTDDNGDNDVTNVKGIFFDSGATDHDCTANENNCYIHSSCALTDVGSGTDNALGADCTVTVWYNANASSAWKVDAHVTDETGTVKFADLASTITNPALQGVGVEEASIAYGALAVGTPSEGKSISAGNSGNQITDLLVSGSNMCTDYPTCSGFTIPRAQQKWTQADGTNFNWDTQGHVLRETAGTGNADTNGCANVDMAVRTDHTSTSSNENLYWKLKIPDVQETGSYTGANTIQTTGSANCTGTP